MQVRWTSEAAQDLDNVAKYLFEQTPAHAPRLIREICKAPNELKMFPHRGRPGKKEGTRELVLSSLPYILVYQVRGDVLYVVRILHGAQQWPG
jgi:toxin ParE1/3/4